MWNSIMNTLRLIWNELRFRGQQAWDWGTAELEGIRDGLILISLVQALVMVLGVVIGWLGAEVLGWGWVTAMGRFLIAGAALYFGIGLIWLWARSGFLTEVLVVSAAVARRIPIPVFNFPDLEVGRAGTDPTQWRLDMRDWIEVHHADLPFSQEQATRFLRMLMGVMAWLALVGVYATHVPVYRNPVAFMGVLVAGLFVAYATVGWNMGTRFGEKAVYYAVIALILLSTVAFFVDIAAAPGLVMAWTHKALAAAKTLPALVAHEIFSPRMNATNRMYGMWYAYGALAGLSLIIFLFALAYYFRTSGVRKVAAAVVGLMMLVAALSFGWYVAMSRSYAGVATQAKAPVGANAPAPNAPVPAPGPGVSKAPAVPLLSAAPAAGSGLSKRELHELNQELVSMKEKLKTDIVTLEAMQF